VAIGARPGTCECLVYLIFCAIIATGYSLASHFRVYFRKEADERLIRDLAYSRILSVFGRLVLRFEVLT